MPTEKKRVNLTLPDQVYERIQQFRKKNGITTDSAACLQLIIMQLDGLDRTDQMMNLVSRFSLDELTQLSNDGLQALKFISEQQKQP